MRFSVWGLLFRGLGFRGLGFRGLKKLKGFFTAYGGVDRLGVTHARPCLPFDFGRLLLERL